MSTVHHTSPCVCAVTIETIMYQDERITINLSCRCTETKILSGKPSIKGFDVELCSTEKQPFLGTRLYLNYFLSFTSLKWVLDGNACFFFKSRKVFTNTKTRPIGATSGLLILLYLKQLKTGEKRKKHGEIITYWGLRVKCLIRMRSSLTCWFSSLTDCMLHLSLDWMSSILLRLLASWFFCTFLHIKDRAERKTRLRAQKQQMR